MKQHYYLRHIDCKSGEHIDSCHLVIQELREPHVHTYFVCKFFGVLNVMVQSRFLNNYEEK
jgi:hypothetical protein